MGSPESLLISLGGLAMRPPTFTRLIRAFGAVHNAEITVLEEFLKPRPDKESDPQPTSPNGTRTTVLSSKLPCS